MKLLTVSREFGSGDRELGKRLADELGFAYYDREIIEAIAEKLRLNERYIETSLERDITVNYPYTFRRSFSTRKYEPNPTARIWRSSIKSSGPLPIRATA